MGQHELVKIFICSIRVEQAQQRFRPFAMNKDFMQGMDKEGDFGLSVQP